MLKVKTDVHALVLATLMVSALSFFMSRTGLYLDAPRAWTPDALIFDNLKAGAVYILPFLAGHLTFRKLGVASRWAYGGLAAACCLAAFAILMPRANFERLFETGTVSLFLLFGAVAGAVFGFLYHWRSGYDAEGDRPSALAATLSGRMAKVTGAETPRPMQPQGGPTVASAGPSAFAPQPASVRSPSVSDDGALVDTGESEYFNGPLQVRTSLPVMFVASLGSTVLYGVGKYIVGMAFAASKAKDASPEAIFEAAYKAAGYEGFGLALFVFTATLPFVVVIYAGHMAARALNKTSYAAYGAIGLLTPIVMGLFVFIVGAFIGVQVAIPAALAMMVYRNMAGLEPKPVKEDIMVKDRRNLVGANHARRTFGRVVGGA